MKWCKICLLPDTRPNLYIRSDGRCNACNSHVSKQEVDWVTREKTFRNVVDTAKVKSTGYDCLIPVSGGKDSTWQVVKCLEYGLRPLAVTWKTPGRTLIGRNNLENLVSLGVDHIDYQINPKVEAKFMLKTFRKMGSTAIPMHLALFNIPLSIAVNFNIPLVIWGENSAFEYGSAKEVHEGFRLNKEWLENYGVTNGTTASDWVDSSLSKSDLKAYFGPTSKDLVKAEINAVFLGYYFKWDPQETRDIAMLNGFKVNNEGSRVGYYDYADIDDDFISLHHWLKWYKFGFTRTFDNLSLEIRNGRMTRDAAIEIIKNIGDETPFDDIESFCAFANISSKTFMEMAEKFRNKKIWKRNTKSEWFIENFIIPDWNWS